MVMDRMKTKKLGGALGGEGGRKEPDTTIIAGASSWRGTFTQCGGIPRMMAGSLVVAGEQVGATTSSRQPGGRRPLHQL